MRSFRRTVSHRTGDSLRNANCGRTRTCSPTSHCAPRPEASERNRHSKRECEGVGFWSGDEAAPEELEAATVSQAQLGEPDSLAGTLPYMAPEQLEGGFVDARSDIWALGVLMYEMASGHRPFSGRSAFALTSAILRDPPPLLPDTVPAGLAGVIRKCLLKDPVGRYQNAGEVRSALEALELSTASRAALPKSPAGKVPRTALLTLILLGLAVLVVVLFATNVGGLRERLVHAARLPESVRLRCFLSRICLVTRRRTSFRTE